ncbi:energy transducer TonB [Thermodesulfobacteriota bacterium]
MPAVKGSRPQSKGSKQAPKGKLVPPKNKPAKRIKPVKKEAKPLVVAKRTVQKKAAPAKKPKVSSTKMIDKAISRIKAKVKSEDRSHVARAISKLENKVEGSPSTGRTGGLPGGGIQLRIYQADVENQIKSNWSYPVALEKRSDLEAIVIVMVKNDGTILKTRFEKKSADAMFDQSVIRAVERSDPLPPFPEGYRKSYDEIQITFNLKELEGF